VLKPYSRLSIITNAQLLKGDWLIASCMDISSAAWEKGLDNMLRDAEELCREAVALEETVRPEDTTDHLVNRTLTRGDSSLIKVDLLLKKVKANEDAIRKLQNSHKLVVEIVQKVNHKVRTDTARHEARMSEQMKELKQYVDHALNSTSKRVNKDKSVPSPVAEVSNLPSIDMGVVNDYVASKVHIAFSRNMERLRDDLRTQQDQQASRTEEALARDKCEYEGLRTAVTALEREAGRAKAEALRLKGRYDVIESSHRDLNEELSRREQAMEEAHKRVVGICRTDTQRLMEATSRKINESISETQDGIFSEMRRLEGKEKATSQTVKALTAWRKKTDEQAALSEQIVVQLFTQHQQAQENARAQRATLIGLTLATEEIQATLKRMKVAATPDVRSTEEGPTSSTTLPAASDNLLSCVEPFKPLVAEVKTFEHSTESWRKRTSGKIRQLSTIIHDVPVLRQSLQKVLDFLYDKALGEEQAFAVLDRRTRQLEHILVGGDFPLVKASQLPDSLISREVNQDSDFEESNESSNRSADSSIGPQANL
jgi:hypothetical protein